LKKKTSILLSYFLTFILTLSGFFCAFEKKANAETINSKFKQVTTNKDTIKQLLQKSSSDLLKSKTVKTNSVNNLSSINLSFNPVDTVMDPDRPIIYMTDGDTNKIHAINYETGEIKSIQLNLQPERVVIANNELYVTLLKVPHNSYNFDNHIGAIAIVNAETFKLTEQFDINEDPFDIQVDNQGYIYIAPGSGQWESVVVYSRQTKQEVSRRYGIYERSFIHLLPNSSKIYAIDTTISPRDIETYVYSNGICQDYYDSPYHGDYSLDINMRISPDGKYIFNGSGNIFKCSNARQYDMTYLNKLSSPFTDIAFDLNSNFIYAAQQNGNINVYNYETFAQISTLQTEGIVRDLYYGRNKLLAISKTPNNTFILERKSLSNDPLEPLKIEATYPINNSTNLPVQGGMAVKFNKGIVVKNANFTLTNSNNQQLPLGEYGVDQDVFYITYENLAYSTKYTLTIKGGSISDYNNNVYSSDVVLNFTTGAEFNRLCGLNRYETSTKISQSKWFASDYIVLATGENFPDALCAAPLATRYNAPILLTPSNALDPNIELEITRLQPKNIFIVGGPGAVSDAIKQKLESKGIIVTRIYGQSRYDTSLEVAKHLGNTENAFIVTGNNYPDALSIASFAAFYETPILLTDYDSIPANTRAYIQNTGIKNTFVIGGTGVISNNVLTSLPNGVRIAGRDRYETNYVIFSSFPYNYTSTYIATGENFADALSCSSLAGSNNSPIILVTDDMSQGVINALRQSKDKMKMKITLGGTGAVSDNIVNRIFK